MTEPFSTPHSHDLFARYLALLGQGRSAPTGRSLFALVRAQMELAPFENISKLYYLKQMGLHGIPSLQQYLDGIERDHFGGTCYSNNYYFGELLRHLGYHARLCGADMTNPDVHIVNLVSVDGREFLVDVGYGAPFLEPMPRDLPKDYILLFGQDRYVLKPQDDEGRSRLEMYRTGELAHGYTVKPIERSLEHFAPAIEGSYRPYATFMNALLIARYTTNRGIVIHNLSVIETSGSEVTTRTLSDRQDIPFEVEKLFGIPHDIVAEAVGQLGPFTNPWS